MQNFNIILKKYAKGIIFVVVMFLVISFVLNAFSNVSDLSYSKLVLLIEENQVESIKLSSNGNIAQIKLKEENSIKKCVIPSVDSITELLIDNELKGNTISFEMNEKNFEMFLFVLKRTLILACLIFIVFIYYILKNIIHKICNKKLLSDREKEIVAYHETGHAIACFVFAGKYKKVSEISIIPEDEKLGEIIYENIDENGLESKRACLDEICISLAGHVVEKIILGEEYLGSEDDLAEATKIATNMVTKSGMSNTFGTMVFSDSEIALIKRDINNPINIEIRNILDECYEKVEKELKNNIDLINKVAKTLINKGKISGKEFNKLIS